ncbi:MAG: hypothetical protein JSR17_02295 [Proteobacteria bacterium]|nr:hypothetical protein [Pseudomonadota bacterium]
MAKNRKIYALMLSPFLSLTGDIPIFETLYNLIVWPYYFFKFERFNGNYLSENCVQFGTLKKLKENFNAYQDGDIIELDVKRDGTLEFSGNHTFRGYKKQYKKQTGSDIVKKTWIPCWKRSDMDSSYGTANAKAEMNRIYKARKSR